MDEPPVRVEFSMIETEMKLEDVLAQDLSILDPDLLLIGRQVPTAYGKIIDFLAMDREGNLVVIELKRDKTPREVVAQLLDYGSWVQTLEDEDIATLFEGYLQKHAPDKTAISLDEAFREKFGVDDLPEALNEAHELLVVAARLDDSTERIINYLTDFGVAVNAAFFRFFKDDDREYLSRAWLNEPDQIDAKVAEKRAKLPWNGEYYVSYGIQPHRRWEDAVKYGYISAGGGAWYTHTLSSLSEGDRVWVNAPSHGYVGVGVVRDEVVPIDDFKVPGPGGSLVPLLSQPLEGADFHTRDKSLEKVEHMVAVDWIKTVPLDQAVKEKGFFGNQNTVARPRASSWRHTIERLKIRFGISA